MFLQEMPDNLNQVSIDDEWDLAAEYWTTVVRLARMRVTGFGHRPAGLKLQMSDRTYEIQKNGEYRRIA
jgi:hypothetical protein